MIATRADIHRPSAIDPAQYRFVAFERESADDPPALILANRERIRADMFRTGGTYSRHQHGGNCHVCGASAIYTALFHHAPSNTYVRTGLDCAEILDAAVDGAAFRRALKADDELKAGKRKARLILEGRNLGPAFAIFDAKAEARPDRYEERTIADVVGKLVQYGSLSEAQFGLVQKLLERIPARAAIAAARTAEHETAEPAPVTTERIRIVGEIVKITPPPEYFQGERPRMIIKTAAGWLCMGSLPIALDDAKRGDRIEFFAKVRRSDQDEKFAFASRPTKARMIEAAP